LTTALRETQEEAGLSSSQLHILSGFKSQISYMAWGQPKVSVYLLAELRDAAAAVTLSHEHIAWRWAGLEAACALAAHPEMQAVLRQADDFIAAGQC